uniref:Pogo transposable element n=1 Tax=Rhipicephalus microplus TaxID=6941 RepID=G0WS00_RHIMP|nr:pogo transposable element [Rhipicephalus microplus]
MPLVALLALCISIDGVEWPTPKTRVHHDATFKRKVIACAETNGNQAASRSFGVPETCVRDRRKQKQKIFDNKALRKGFSGPQQGEHAYAKIFAEEYDEKLHCFQRFVLNLRRNNDYLLGQIGNADQTPLYFDMPGTTTVEKKGAKQVRVLTSVHGKTTVTAMLCYTSDGHKLRPYLIFKWKTLSKGVVFSSGVIMRASEKKWKQ